MGRWPDAPRPWLDLSTGINPHSWPVDRAGPIDWRRLPDEEAVDRLETAAASYFNVPPEQVCATPGSEIALRVLNTLDLPQPIHVVSPGYRGHIDAFPGAVPVQPGEIGTLRSGSILFARPSNPQGQTWSLPKGVEQWIIDEAFADTVNNGETAGHPGAIVLRSFGKFFGLAGVRLGFVIAPPALTQIVRKALGSWPVSAAAIAIGTAAYLDRDWHQTMRRRLYEESAVFDRLLHDHGLRPTGDCPLFRLVQTDDAGALFFKLAAQGILTRPFDYDPRWLRLGLPEDDAALSRLDRALE